MASPKKRSEDVYVALRRAIIEQALRPGTKLPEDSIGESFGISRTGVRNALLRLSIEGLVEIQLNKGATVATPTLDEAFDVFLLRRLIEAEVVKRLCENLTEGAIDALEAHVKEEEDALHSASPRSIRLAGEFHILLAELTESKYLTEIVNQVVSRSSLILAQFGRPHSAECGVDEHLALISALKDQDADRAVEIMTTHLNAVEDRAAPNSKPSAPDIGSILREYVDGN